MSLKNFSFMIHPAF